MRKYEMLVILEAAAEADQAGETAQIEELIKRLGGNLIKTDVWGKRTLAYPIRKKPKVIMCCSTLSLNLHRHLNSGVYLVCVLMFTVSLLYCLMTREEFCYEWIQPCYYCRKSDERP